ncbi:Hsp20/alpha crystallin family protein [Spirosoma sp.]|uniref:Hsp20/alpha crystallin family protein n=1 Tax=Spirosoma sp. TaxID=1899569 RepID=UPI00262BAC52|nr:Hsp20/alpha crystallin family protein [Spirosoma sp.]MCX6216284.1 Hsp20/alpha crystallin family protein [Spirosoma sp.]
MYNRQAYQSEHKGGCGQMGRGGFGGKWGRGKFGGFWARQAGSFFQPPVNIQETDAEYIISLFAAGLAKENVKLSVKDDVLTISYEGDDASATNESGTTGNYTYQEHGNRPFERSFQLNDKVITENISASYADGILKVILPKNPATNKPAQTISVG